MPEVNSEAKVQQFIDLVCRHVVAPGKVETSIPGLMITRWNESGHTDNCFYEPSIGLILQGKKESVIGTEVFQYGALDYLVNGVDMPTMSRVLEASPEAPLLSISMFIDRALAVQIVSELDAHIPMNDDTCSGISMAAVEEDIFDTFFRIVSLLDTPERIPLMAPLLVRELITRVLMGMNGASLRMLCQYSSYHHQITKAISWLKENYVQTLQVDELARFVNMGTSTFHRRFKAITSMSPLQYQKRLRLYEAQRLMLTSNVDANTAARAVGYQSSQQFNREYKRLFGNPPHRNINQLRTSQAE